MDFLTEAKKVWNVVRSPKAVAVFKLAAAVMGVGIAIEGVVKALKTDSKIKSEKVTDTV
jgi:hypothetical protein